MKFCITEPCFEGQKYAAVGNHMMDHLRQYWQDLRGRMVSKAPAAQTMIHFAAKPHMIHGELLREVWEWIRADIRNRWDGQETYVISEIDFIPYYSGFARLQSAVPGEPSAIFTPFLTRDENQGVISHWPLVAPWFIVLQNLSPDKLPPLDWLDAAGPRNDAANLALRKLLDSGAVKEENVKQVGFQDLQTRIPGFRFMSTEHEDFGAHVFFSGRYGEDPGYELLPGYTLREHFQGLREFLYPFGHVDRTVKLSES